MTDHSDYFDYLQRRSWCGALYRRLYLYPRLCSFLHGRVLDVGCGLGDMLAFRPNTIGTDINEKCVAFCQSKSLEAVVMGPDQLPFQDESFDGVILDNVLEHLAQPKPLLAEIVRVLKPGGSFLLGVPGVKGFAFDADHKVFYDEAALCQLMREAGFTKKKLFAMPLRFPFLTRLLRPFCLYGVFTK